MESSATSVLPEVQLKQAELWWSDLSEPWKKAFNEVALQRDSIEELPSEMLLTVYTCPNHRFAGPTAPYPNMSFELDDMSGLVGLPAAVVVVVTFQKLKHIREVASMQHLRSLFIFNNQIISLDGIENLTELNELYLQSNEVTTLKPLQNLVNLKNLYCTNNLLTNLEGIGPQHADTLENFFCLPNDHLKATTVFGFEQATNIRCRKG